MPEGIRLPDGSPVDVAPAGAGEGSVDAAFARAMAQPAEDIPAPPDHNKPLPDPGEKPKPRRGRPPKQGAQATAKAPAPVKADYTDDIRSVVSTTWLLTASVPVTQPYALVLSNGADGLVAALNEGCKRNDTLRRWVAGSGDSMWQVSLAGAVAGMGMQAYQLYKDEDLRGRAAEATRQQLAEMVRATSVQVPEAQDGAS